MNNVVELLSLRIVSEIIIDNSRGRSNCILQALFNSVRKKPTNFPKKQQQQKKTDASHII
jgi:hypothetical protein